jgi:O-antigen ligase
LLIQRIKNITIYNIFLGLFSIYVFIIPFAHTAAIRNISLYGSMLLFIVLVMKKEIILNYKNIIFGIFTLYFLEAIVSIFINQVDVSGSLKEIKQNLFEQFYILIVVLSVFKTKKNILYLVKVLAFSYITLTLLSFIEVAYFDYKYGFEYLLQTWQRGEYRFWGGYSRISVIYLPILFGYIVYMWKCFAKNSKIVYISILLISVFLVILYQSSSVIVFLAISLIIPFLFAKDKKLFFIGLIIGSLSIFAFDKLILNGKITNKIFDPIAYKFNNFYALDGRSGIWQGVTVTLDDLNTKLLGYGYGWKKLSIITKKEKYLKKYKEKNDVAFSYFKDLGYGKANPHNTYLEILFTTGIIGLFLILSLLFISCYSILKYKNKLAIFIILPLLISFMLNALTNGYWEGGSGKIIVIFFAFAYLMKELNEKNNLPSS